MILGKYVLEAFFLGTITGAVFTWAAFETLEWFMARRYPGGQEKLEMDLEEFFEHMDMKK